MILLWALRISNHTVPSFCNPTTTTTTTLTNGKTTFFALLLLQCINQYTITH